MSVVAKGWRFCTQVWSTDNSTVSALGNWLNFRKGRKSFPLQPYTMPLACSHHMIKNRTKESRGTALLVVFVFTVFGWFYNQLILDTAIVCVCKAYQRLWMVLSHLRNFFSLFNVFFHTYCYRILREKIWCKIISHL